MNGLHRPISSKVEVECVFAVRKEARHFEHKYFSLLVLDLKLEDFLFVLAERRLAVNEFSAELVAERAHSKHLFLREKLYESEAFASFDVRANYFD